MADSPPETGSKLFTPAVLAFCGLWGTVFAYPPGEDLYHGKPLTLRMAVFMGIASACAFGGPVLTLVHQRYSTKAQAIIRPLMANPFSWLFGLIMLLFLFYGPEIFNAPDQDVTAKITAMQSQLSEVQQRLSHTLWTGLDDYDFSGRPLGFAWDASGFDIRWIDQDKRILGASRFTLTGKNFGAWEIQLQDSYIVSAIDGTKLRLKIQVPSNTWIALKDAGPVPPKAQFELSAKFDSGSMLMPEAVFLQRWRSFYVVVKANGKEIRHEVPESRVRGAFDINLPEAVPHVERRSPPAQ